MQNQKNTGDDDRSSSENIQHGAVDHTRLVERAHHKFLARGGEHGHDEEDWLEAEAELRQEMTAGQGSEHAPTAKATELEAQRHAREAQEGHLAAGVNGRLKASDSKTNGTQSAKARS